MSMRVSINGIKPTQVESVVIYKDNVPVAAAANLDGENVIYADSIRDPEFANLLQRIGVNLRGVRLPEVGPTIKGELSFR